MAKWSRIGEWGEPNSISGVNGSRLKDRKFILFYTLEVHQPTKATTRAVAIAAVVAREQRSGEREAPK
jgi:hypothetical protein